MAPYDLINVNKMYRVHTVIKLNSRFFLSRTHVFYDDVVKYRHCSRVLNLRYFSKKIVRFRTQRKYVQVNFNKKFKYTKKCISSFPYVLADFTICHFLLFYYYFDNLYILRHDVFCWRF